MTERERIAQDLRAAAEAMKDADRTMSKVFTEYRHLLQECDRLRNRVRGLEMENRKLNKWRDIGERIDKAIKEAENEPLRPD